ncbi:MAG: hypothetical protein KKE89_00240 [Actinobacteria bacterium]|nr:hypothetical protein [Actinomycetota bacterium]
MKPDEAAFESHIAGWLADHGGYTAWKLGTQSADFNAGVDVLRHGVVYAGHEKAAFALARFRPASGLNPLLAQRYDANRLTVTRQLRYEPGTNKTVDLGLFVNRQGQHPRTRETPRKPRPKPQPSRGFLPKCPLGHSDPFPGRSPFRAVPSPVLPEPEGPRWPFPLRGGPVPPFRWFPTSTVI